MSDLSTAADWSDDEPTLVHSRDASEIRTRALITRPQRMAPIPPPLPFTLQRVSRELAPDDLWLASLPAASRAILDQARRGDVHIGRVVSPIA